MKQRQGIWKYIVATTIGLALLLGPAIAAGAVCDPNQQSCSSNYGVNEVFFGAGGQLCEPGVSGYSASYCAKTSVGETGVGNGVGTAYQDQAGFNTNRAPFLELDITAGSTADLGYLSTSTTATTTTTFQVKSYLASSYFVKIVGNPPTNSALTPHSLTALTSGGTSSTGTEQFGINLRDNATPNVGTDPVQLPDSSFSFGSVASNYNTIDTFRYNSGDTIAQSAKSSGFTQYTISFIFNISNLTPDGLYAYHGSLVATSTF